MATRNVILVLCLLAVGCSAQSLPSTNVTDVKEIIARLDEDDDPNWRGKPFVVASQDHDSILALFRDGAVDPSPMKRYPLGRIEIDYKDGHQTGIALYWTGATKGGLQDRQQVLPWRLRRAVHEHLEGVPDQRVRAVSAKPQAVRAACRA